MPLTYENIINSSNATFNINNSATTWTLDAGSTITINNAVGIAEAANYHLNKIVVNGTINANFRGINSHGSETTIEIGTSGNFSDASSTAILMDGPEAKLINRGTIAGSFDIESKSAVVDNFGTVGKIAGFTAMQANSEFKFTNHVGATVNWGVFVSNNNMMDTSNVTTVINEGTIQHVVNAICINGSDGRELITNHGTIKDNAVLGGGDDVFDNRGGTMEGIVIGGEGNDVYFLDKNIAITENNAQGTDTVNATYSINLTTGFQNVELEDIVLLGTTNLSATGNALANKLTGNAGNNILNGLGGTDILVGGAGNDTYYLDDADTVTEATNGGTDTVRSTLANYTLTDNVEKLFLTGTTAQNGTGNAGNNTLTGNGLSNKLFGKAGNDSLNGGAGTDTMTGDVGNDTYYVDVSTDKVIEAANQGTDSVRSTATSYTLAVNAERLYLVGTGNQNGTGNSGNNLLVGNAKNNILSGMGGTDALTGGLGADTFVFKTGFGKDTVTDFVAGKDTIDVHSISAITSFADLLAQHATEKSGDVIITAGSDTLILDGVKLSSLHSTDFII